MSYGTPYFATPIKPVRVERTFNKMSKAPTTNEAPKASRKYSKTRGEHFKDMVIVALVAAIIAFVGGMHFQNNHDTQVVNASKTTQAVVAPAKK